jgi:hypothetical protein
MGRVIRKILIMGSDKAVGSLKAGKTLRLIR